MFNPFKRATIDDPRLGTLRRSRGAWRGVLLLHGARVPLVLGGPRSGPDTRIVEAACAIPSAYSSWRADIARALREHYEPYAEAVAAGEEERPAVGLLPIAAADDVWPHASIEFVQVGPLDGRLTVEIGYRVAWDEEHTLGARLVDGRLVELCGSVLAP